jgi:fatty acid CoA ligase FadD21
MGYAGRSTCAGAGQSGSARGAVGQMRELLIVYGRNHYPEDIELTGPGVTGGLVDAISVPVNQTEKLVTIIELKKRGDSDEEAMRKLGAVSRRVSPGAISATTGGKIRRAACVEQYRQQQFTRLDV